MMSKTRERVDRSESIWMFELEDASSQFIRNQRGKITKKR